LDEKMLKILVALAAVLVSIGVDAQSIDLPNIGDPSREYLGSNQEAQLGYGIYQELLAGGYIVQDGFLQEYIDSVGQKIATHARRDGGQFTFFLINDPTINAFALPGGYIGVHTGLLLATHTESELAGVLAHEAAHVTQLHIARRFAYQSQMRIPNIAATIAAALVASQAGGDGVAAAVIGASAFGTQGQIDFTRSNEYEADRVGTDFLVRSGFDPNGMPDFFERLARNSRLQGGGELPEFLRTHPVETNRIAEARARVAKISYRRPRSSGLRYYQAKARTVALTTRDPDSMAERFAARLAQGKYRSAQAERYGLAISLRRAGRLGEAWEQIGVLLKENAESLPYLLEGAGIALQRNDSERAKSLFQTAERLYPGDYSLALSYGDALVKAGQNRKALHILRPALRRDPGYADAYALYARAALQSGMIADSHAHMAVFYDLRGQPRLALQQIRIGLQDPQVTPYQRSRMEAHQKLLEEALDKEARS
jgi:predicted Zn-dependent protease